ncbi:Replication initiation and membrane attachment protein [Bacillus sp. FJAT-27225]|uniref:replication initiation and membrane attachment family protein n=1 Tax=Bacillus sp. FJAT-27225 TaxID=1743144 RepID=UPI00080C323F|nr:replication initiation and membrane attachment family protein [Bacillus sp. FJAT-27225]OCA91349.1 Replication initiation and membrane attachment protein [Bacillus sp. FJAT-27225]
MAQHWQELVPVDRYVVSSNGLLHDYDRKILSFLYQPLIGPDCFSVYLTLWGELEENRLWADPSSHHFLMNMTGMNLKGIYEARLKLEGIGLLKTYVKSEDEIRSFIYELQPPLSPEQFFMDGMLNVYLYRKIGKNNFARLKRFFCDGALDPSGEYQDVTKAFQEVYASAPLEGIHYLQDNAADLEVEEGQQFIGRDDPQPIQIPNSTFDFDLLASGLSDSLLPKKALNQKVKDAISNLAFLYSIDVLQMKNIVLGAINENDEIDLEELRKAARDWYQFVHYDKLPSLVERVQPPPYREQLEEPKTQDEKLIHYFETASPLQVLRDLSGGAEPSAADLQIIEEVMFNQKLMPGVVNALIQTVMIKSDMKMTKAYVERIASHWARKQIKTAKQAVDLSRKEHKKYLEWKNSGSSPAATGGKRQTKKNAVRTEILPDWFDEESNKAHQEDKGQTAELEARKKEVEEKLKAFRN